MTSRDAPTYRPPAADAENISRLRRAAEHALAVLPPALGRIVAREFAVTADMGWRGKDSLVEDAATEVLAMPRPAPPRATKPHVALKTRV